MAHGDSLEGNWRRKMLNAVGSQYPSHYLGTCCTQHYYRWCTHLGCQQSTELTPTGRFKWTRPFGCKDKSDFSCECAITFQIQSTAQISIPIDRVKLWLLPGYYMVTAWLVPGYLLVTTWSLPGYYPVTNLLLPGYFLVAIRLLPGYCLVTAGLLPSYCLVTCLLLPGYFLATTCLLPGYCLVVSWLLPCYCVVTS